VQARIQAAQEAIQTAQRSANEETKSSAGDKYETGRAMAQLEIEKHSAQLAESLKLKHALDQISVDDESEIIRIGSAVMTNQENFYLAISAGQFSLEGKIYFTLSPASPLGQKLMGLKIHESFTYNKKVYEIHEVL
jgi:transcription elongation GreA/GreB family factor